MKIKTSQLLIIILIFFSLATAQFPRHHDKWDKDKREKIEELRIWKMTEFLDLTPSQAEKFFPLLKEHDKRTFRIIRQKHKLLRDLYGKTKEEDYNPSDQEVDKILEEMRGIDDKIKTENLTFIKEIDFLTNRQRVKYIVFDSRFKSHLLKALKEHHKPRSEQ